MKIMKHIERLRFLQNDSWNNETFSFFHTANLFIAKTAGVHCVRFLIVVSLYFSQSPRAYSGSLQLSWRVSQACIICSLIFAISKVRLQLWKVFEKLKNEKVLICKKRIMEMFYLIFVTVVPILKVKKGPIPHFSPQNKLF